MQATHAMLLAGSPEPGADEWYCPSCGRRLVIRWPPRYEKSVLERGDESALHIGARSGLQLGGVAIRPAEPAGMELAREEREWLHQHGIAWDEPPA